MAAAGVDRLDDDVRWLRDEVRELDDVAVKEVAAGSVPVDAKGVADGAGALVVTLSDSAVLVALTGVLRSWVGRERGRKIVIRIGEDSVEIENPSEEEQAELVRAWLGRYEGG